MIFAAYIWEGYRSRQEGRGRFLEPYLLLLLELSERHGRGHDFGGFDSRGGSECCAGRSLSQSSSPDRNAAAWWPSCHGRQGWRAHVQAALDRAIARAKEMHEPLIAKSGIKPDIFIVFDADAIPIYFA